MLDRLSAERACKEPNPIIDGRKANVNLAYLGAKPRTNGIGKCALQPYTSFSLHLASAGSGSAKPNSLNDCTNNRFALMPIHKSA